MGISRSLVAPWREPCFLGQAWGPQRSHFGAPGLFLGRPVCLPKICFLYTVFLDFPTTQNVEHPSQISSNSISNLIKLHPEQTVESLTSQITFFNGKQYTKPMQH